MNRVQAWPEAKIPAEFFQAAAALAGKRVLVTGATSGLGRTAAGYLQRLALPCVATGRNPQVVAQLNAQGIEAHALDLAEADDAALDRLLAGVDVVWHCAALSSPWGAYPDFYAANVLAVRKLAEAAERAGVKRLVHISTPSLYFRFRHRHRVAEDDVDWHTGRRFANHYIRTKWMAEAYLAEFCRHSTLQAAVLRPRAIFGAHDRVLLPKILALYRAKNGCLPLPAGGRVKMDVTFADNVVYAMLLAGTAPLAAEPLPVFNITNQEAVSLYDLLYRLIAVQMGLPFAVRRVPYWLLAALARLAEGVGRLNGKEPQLTAYSAGVLYYDMTLDTRRAEQQLGYRAPYSLDEAVARTAAVLSAQMQEAA